MAERRALGWPRLLSTGALVAAAAAFVTMLVASSHTQRVGWDFRFEYFPAAEAVVDGRSPYRSLDDPGLESALAEAKTYPYPPFLAVSVAPLTALSVDAATVVALLVSIGALLAALAIVGLRDPRCYAAVLASSPAWSALHVVNVTPFLVLGVALAWRFRARVWALAAVIGVTVSCKLFLWPLLVWLAATRRLRAGAFALGAAAVVTTAAWAVIGFAGLESYPELLRRLSDIHAANSYSLVGIAAALGLGAPVGHALMLVAGALLIAACVTWGRRGDDLLAFTAALGTSLALTPIVWQHYLLLLLVPLAVARPRFSVVWLVPMVLWVVPLAGNGDGLQPLLPALVAIAVAWAILVRTPVDEGLEPVRQT